MADRTQQISEDLATLITSAFVDVPLTLASWAVGGATQKELEEHAWKGYDAFVRAANDTVHSLYEMPVVRQMTSQALVAILRSQRSGKHVTSAVAAATSPAPAAAANPEVEALRNQILSLREEVTELSTTLAAERGKPDHAPKPDRGAGKSRRAAENTIS